MKCRATPGQYGGVGSEGAMLCGRLRCLLRSARLEAWMGQSGDRVPHQRPEERPGSREQGGG